MNEKVSGYINQAPETHRSIMETVRSLLHESMKGVEEEIKWGWPVFNMGVDLVYLKSERTYVTVGFFKSQKLSDPDSLLEGTGKNMRHIKIRKPDEVNEAQLKKWFTEMIS